MEKIKDNSYVQSNNNISEIYKENIWLKTQMSNIEMRGSSNDTKQFKNMKDEGEEEEMESSWKNVRCCKKKYLFLMLITLVLCIIVMLSIMVTKPFGKTQLPSKQIPEKGKQTGTNGAGNGGQQPNSCDVGNKKSFPDLDYALFGYNILRGYPLAIGHDPGLTHPIFQYDYNEGLHTADCRFNVPKGYILAPDVSCVTSFSSKVIQDSSQFAKSLGVSAEATGGGWGASFSASAEYKDKTSTMSSSESVFILSQAKCNYYFAMIDEIQPPPFHESFLIMIKTLKTEEDFYKFFDYYGTHFLKYTLFGAKFVYENKMSKKDYQKESSGSISVSLKASYSGVLTLSGGAGLTSDQKNSAKEFQNNVETSTITIGAPPPEDGKTLTWAATVKDNPVPVQYKMDSILNLFTETYMGNTGIDYQRLHNNLTHAKTQYCSKLLGEGQVNTCKPTAEAFIEFDNIYFGSSAYTTFKSSRDLCTEKCSDDPKCQGASYYESSQSCYLYEATLHQHSAKYIEHVTSMLFIESMKLLDKTFRIKNIRLPVEVSRETSGNVENATACSKLCVADGVCFAYTFRVGEIQTNCLLFQEQDIVSNSLKFELGSVTIINQINRNNNTTKKYFL